jgi:hypothetical protein
MLVDSDLIEELAALAQTAQHAAYWLAQERQLPPNGKFSRVMANFSSSSQAIRALAWLRERPLMNVKMGVVSPDFPSVDLLRDAFEAVWEESGLTLADPPFGWEGPQGVQRIGSREEHLVSIPAIQRLADMAALVQADAECFRAALGTNTSQAPRQEEMDEKLPHANSTIPHTQQSPPNDQKPRTLLSGWHEIAKALEMRYADRKDISSLNKRFNGPINNQGAGTKPMVYKDVLIEWWNKLAIRAEELTNQQEGAKLSADAQHNYGREATAAPEIGGGVKKRRRDRQT